MTKTELLHYQTTHSVVRILQKSPLSFEHEEIEQCITRHQEENTEDGVHDDGLGLLELFVVSCAREHKEPCVDDKQYGNESYESVDIIYDICHDPDRGIEVRRSDAAYPEKSGIALRTTIHALNQHAWNLEQEKPYERIDNGLFPFLGLVVRSSGRYDEVEGIKRHGEEYERSK